MKKLNILLLLSSILLSNFVYSATFDIRFDTTNAGPNLAKDKYYVKIQIKATSAAEDFDMGGANITFTYNIAALSNPLLDQAHDFSLNPYSPIEVKNPGFVVVSVNVLYLSFMGISGFPVGTTWHDVATVVFDLSDPNACGDFRWNSSSAIIGPFVFTDDLGGSPTEGNKYTFDACPLPVELIHFAVKPDVNDAILDWATASEVNNFGFEIQRFNETKKSWDKIDFVYSKAYKGNSDNLLSYNHIDIDVYHQSMGNKTFYYRLKQIDINSIFEYSDIRSATFRAMPEDISIDIYPNPADNFININLSHQMEEYVTVYIYDQNGKLVIEEKIQKNSTLAIDKLSQGFYEVTIRSDEIILKREKLIIVR